MKGSFTVIAAALCVLLGLPSASLAQGGYFGRNKVQYQRLRLPGAQDRALRHLLLPGRRGGRRAWRRAWPSAGTRGCRRCSATSSAAASRSSSTPATRTSSRPTRSAGELGEGTGGVTEALKRRIVLPFAGPLAETDHVLGHELVHAFQYDITGQADVSSAARRRAGACRCGSSKAWPSTCRSARRPAHRDVDARRGAAREAAHDRPARRPAATSRTATARRSGPTSRAATATTSSATCCARRRAARCDVRTAIEEVLGVDAEDALEGLARRRSRPLPADRRRRRRCRRRTAAPLITEKSSGGRAERRRRR